MVSSFVPITKPEPFGSKEIYISYSLQGQTNWDANEQNLNTSYRRAFYRKIQMFLKYVCSFHRLIPLALQSRPGFF